MKRSPLTVRPRLGQVADRLLQGLQIQRLHEVVIDPRGPRLFEVAFTPPARKGDDLHPAFRIQLSQTARGFVAARAGMLGMSDIADATARALALVELGEIGDRRVGTLSKGMRQRVKLAAALVHDPTLVLLDEPFNGLDPRQRLHMMRLLEARAAEGTAVLLSSHILEEIEGVASRILVVLAGRLAATGDYRALRRLMTDRPHTVRVRTSNDRVFASALMQLPLVLGVEVTSGGLMVRTNDYAALARALSPAAKQCDLSLYEVEAQDESLEHVFAYLVQR